MCISVGGSSVAITVGAIRVSVDRGWNVGVLATEGVQATRKPNIKNKSNPFIARVLSSQFHLSRCKDIID